jgi:hypothetical protein
MADRHEPLVLATLLCEKVLEEKDGVLTAVRMFDRLLVAPPEPGSVATVPIVLLIVLRNGTEVTREAAVGMRLVTPSGSRGPREAYPVELAGEPDAGVNLRVTLPLDASEEGLYWFEIDLDGIPVSRVPLRLTFAPASPVTPTPAPPISHAE